MLIYQEPSRLLFFDLIRDEVQFQDKGIGVVAEGREGNKSQQLVGITRRIFALETDKEQQGCHDQEMDHVDPQAGAACHELPEGAEAVVDEQQETEANEDIIDDGHRIRARKGHVEEEGHDGQNVKEA